MFAINNIIKKIQNDRDLKTQKNLPIIEIPPNAILYAEIVPDIKYPRSTCRYRDLKYLDNKDLIDYPNNLYFYNSCLCENTPDTYQLFYRAGAEPKGYCDRIATCLLTKDLKFMYDTNMYIQLYSNWEESAKTLQLKNMVNFKFKNGEHVEDPRVIRFNNAWFVFYTDGLRIGVAKLEIVTCETIYSHYLYTPRQALHGESDGREKNWIPFVSGKTLYILYSDMPRTIIECYDTEISLEMKPIFYTSPETQFVWNYGAIRGGSPPVDYNEYSLIWFFHSQKSFETHIGLKRVYMIGVYVSENVFPFTIQKYSQLPLLIGIPAEASSIRSLQDCVVFPCGAVKTESGWKISMGVNDHETAFLDVNESHFLWKNI